MKKRFFCIFMTIFIVFNLILSNVLFADSLEIYETVTPNSLRENKIPKKINEINFKKFFGDTQGCAVFYSSKNDEYDIYNIEMAYVKEIPCSTFKIISSLAGLKYGIIKNENTILKWDKSKQMMKEWEQDLDCKSAFKLSANWYFERIEKAVGNKNMNEILKQINYGNMDTTGDGNIYAESNLKISPMEQVELMKKLFNNELPFEKKHMEIVRNIMLTDSEKGKLYGKTGTSGTLFLEDGAQTAWFVGSYKTNYDEFYFAVRIYGDKDNKNIKGKDAQNIAELICKNVYYKK